jgi:hypothetical protein
MSAAVMRLESKVDLKKGEFFLRMRDEEVDGRRTLE